MLTTQDKIIRLSALLELLDNTVEKGTHKRSSTVISVSRYKGICYLYKKLSGSLSLGNDIPELLKKGTEIYGGTPVYELHLSKEAFFWWPLSKGKYYLKRYRAIVETIRELETKLKKSCNGD